MDNLGAPGLFVRLTDAIGGLGKLAATVVIWALAAVMVYDVAMRGLGIAQLWASEVSIYLMLALAFLGAGATLSVDGHFRVTFVRDICPAPIRLAMDLFAVLLTLGVALAMSYGAWQVVSFSLMLNLTTSTLLRIPLYLLYSVILAGCVMLSIAALREVVLVIRKGPAHRDASGVQEVA